MIYRTNTSLEIFTQNTNRRKFLGGELKFFVWSIVNHFFNWLRVWFSQRSQQHCTAMHWKRNRKWICSQNHRCQCRSGRFTRHGPSSGNFTWDKHLEIGCRTSLHKYYSILLFTMFFFIFQFCFTFCFCFCTVELHDVFESSTYIFLVFEL